jgi:hypothetical protein
LLWGGAGLITHFIASSHLAASPDSSSAASKPRSQPSTRCIAFALALSAPSDSARAPAYAPCASRNFAIAASVRAGPPHSSSSLTNQEESLAQKNLPHSQISLAKNLYHNFARKLWLAIVGPGRRMCFLPRNLPSPRPACTLPSPTYSLAQARTMPPPLLPSSRPSLPPHYVHSLFATLVRQKRRVARISGNSWR